MEKIKKEELKRWTVSDFKNGIDLKRGMICLDENGIEVVVNYLGDSNCVITDMCLVFEKAVNPKTLSPLPLNAFEVQKECFKNELLNKLTEKEIEELYNNLKDSNLFKY